ncbi:MAG TPA: T9SS type A sorting domain-containing protein [Chitinophagaceae bacterium]|nr:T9SS type A sorting domain-containing protein [Chitinophagaceae bacterium]
MKQKILSILFCALCINCFSQAIIGPQKTLGGNADDQLGGLWPTTDGGLVLGGRSYSNISGEKTETNRGVDDYWVVKLDKAGSIQWQRTLGGTDVDEILALQQTKDGGYILAGNSVSSPSADKAENKGVFDLWVIKLNSFGSVEWQKTLGGDSYEFCNSVQQTKDGGYIVGCMSNSNASGDKSENSKGGFDFWLVKLDGSGNKQWDKTLGGSGDEFVNQAIQTEDGGYIAVGLSNSDISGDKSENSKGLNDYWAIKLDRNGNKQWDKTAGGNDNDYVSGVVQTPDGGYALCGGSASTISGDKTEASRGGFDYWLVKLNKKGKIEFNKTIGGIYDEYGQTIENTFDGGLILAGSSPSPISGEKTENSKGNNDYWVVKMKSNGTIAWDKTIGGSGNDYLRSIKEVEKNKYIIGGYSNSDISGDKTEASRGGFDYWVVTLKGDRSFVSTDVSSAATAKIGSGVAENNFNLFPNPTKDIINIHVNGKVIVSLLDQSGKIILSREINGDGKIDVSKLATGLYFLKNDATGVTEKIMVAK